MFGRLLLALGAAPAYGVLVALCVLPLTIVGNLVVAVLAVFAFLLPLVVLIAAFLVQVAIYVQTARYATSFTGAKPMHEYPDFFHAVGLGTLISLIGQVIFIMALVAVVVLFLEYRGGEALWWLDPKMLFGALDGAMREPAAIGRMISFEGFDLDGLLWTLRLMYMALVTTLAIFIVPRSCGLLWGEQRTHTLGLILARYLLAMPFCALMTGLIATMVIWGLQAVASHVAPEFAIIVFVRYGLEFALFTAMIFAFEAIMLRTGREQQDYEGRLARATGVVDRERLRALRHARTDR